MNNTNNLNTGASKKNDSSATFNADGKSLQEKIMNQIKELGDTLERAGEKVEKGGWETIGQAIYKLGNSLEHLNEKFGTKGESKGDSKSSSSFGSSKPYTDKEFDDKSNKSSDLKASASKVGGNDSQAY